MDGMSAARILNTAAELIGGDRAATHGDMHEVSETVARLWSAYTGADIRPEDVSAMMIMLKLVRARLGQHNTDDWIDAAGYAGIGGAVAEAQNGKVQEGRKDLRRSA